MQYFSRSQNSSFVKKKLKNKKQKTFDIKNGKLLDTTLKNKKELALLYFIFCFVSLSAFLH